jgi:hypothetical protein
MGGEMRESIWGVADAGSRSGWFALRRIVFLAGGCVVFAARVRAHAGRSRGSAARRDTVLVCWSLCASGLVGEGQLTTESADSAFALQVDRVTLRDLDGAARVDALQGYVRYDDRERGLALVCPLIEYVETVSSNALRFIALCSNYGAEGWAVSGQVTDGAAAAPDSMSLTVDAPDGTQTSLVGSVTNGVLLMRNAPADASAGP